MFRTPTGIVILFGLIIFSPLLDGGTTHIAVMGIRLLIVLLGCLFLAQGFQNKMVAWPSLPLHAVVVSFLGVAAVSVMLSSYKEASLQWFLVLLCYAGLLYLFVHFVDGWEHITAIIAVMMVMGLFESSLAIHQMLWHRSVRPTGTFFNPNFLAGYLAAIGSIVSGLLCYGKLGAQLARGCRPLFHSNTVKVLLLGSAFGFTFLAIVCTASRAGLMAFLSGVSVVIGVRFGRKGVGLLMASFLLILFLVPNPFRDRFQAEHMVNPETYARWNIWQSSVYVILDHPFGTGLGLYQYIYPRYALPMEGTLSRYGRVAQTAHSEYLQIGVELGIAALMVLGWGIGVLFQEVRQVMSQCLSRQRRGMVVGVVGAITSIMVHAALDSNLHEPAIAIVFILCVGILLAAKRLKKCGQDSVRRIPLETRTSRVLWAGGGTLLAMLLLASILRPGLAWTAYEDGSRAAKQQNHQTAIARYQDAIALEPGKSLYHSSLAASYFQTFERTGDLAMGEATLNELETARHLNPLDGRLWGLQGHVYRTLSEYQHVLNAQKPVNVKQRREWQVLSRIAYENALVLEPFNPMHYLALGRLLFKEGHRERAIGVLRQVTAIEPNFLPAREWLVRIYLESSEVSRAELEYREIADRRERFAATMQNAFETQFLAVDMSALKAALAEAKGQS